MLHPLPYGWLREANRVAGPEQAEKKYADLFLHRLVRIGVRGGVWLEFNFNAQRAAFKHKAHLYETEMYTAMPHKHSPSWQGRGPERSLLHFHFHLQASFSFPTLWLDSGRKSSTLICLCLYYRTSLSIISVIDSLCCLSLSQSDIWCTRDCKMVIPSQYQLLTLLALKKYNKEFIINYRDALIWVFFLPQVLKKQMKKFQEPVISIFASLFAKSLSRN